MPLIEKNCTDDNIPRLLLGTKQDLEARRVVEKEEAEAMAAKFNMKYIEVSSLTGYNVEEALSLIAEKCG